MNPDPGALTMIAERIAELARWAAPATAWMLTYAVHSTLLLAAAWGLGRLLGDRRLALQETVWKLALVGGIATATLQLGLGIEPLAGSWSLPGPAAAAARAAAPPPCRHRRHRRPPRCGPRRTDRRARHEPRSCRRRRVSRRHGGAPAHRAAGGPSTGAAGGIDSSAARCQRPPRRPRNRRAPVPQRPLAAGHGGRCGSPSPPSSSPPSLAAYARLYWRLRERWPVTRGALPALFGRLTARAGRRGVRLSGSHTAAGADRLGGRPPRGDAAGGRGRPSLPLPPGVDPRPRAGAPGAPRSGVAGARPRHRGGALLPAAQPAGPPAAAARSPSTAATIARSS